MNEMSALLRQAGVAARMLILLTLALGVLYPASVFAVSRVVAADKADGAYVTDASGAVVGAENIGQLFDGPQWFTSRPSAAGDGYDALASSASNLAPDNPELVDEVAGRLEAIRSADSVVDVPADAVTASGSGLDPHITPEYAAAQVDRVARERGLSAESVAALVDRYTEQRTLGIFGEPRVNVLMLNLALNQE